MMIDFKTLKRKGARLVAITAVDEKTLIYHFSIDRRIKNFRQKVRKSEVMSIVSLFPNAEFYEREIFETFGIKFKGNPRLKKLFLSERIETPLKSKS